MKLTVIVTCTDRKTLTPHRRLTARELPSGSVDSRVDAWRSRLREPTDTRPLRKLYKGEAWSQVMRLEATTRRAGFEPSLYVASAGLGLRHAESVAPSYAATFSPGQADSVGDTSVEHRAWWQRLNDDDSTADFASITNEPCLMVLSNSYADAMARDLLALRPDRDVLVFGGSDAVASHQRVSADLGLRTALGGTATSLNLRTAIAWVERLDSTRLCDDDIRSSWQAWSQSVRQVVTYDRAPQTDAQLSTLIADLRRANPDISRTAALRSLRDAGIACEQKRFAALFSQATEAS